MSESRPAGASPRRLWLYLCFVASGAAGLILEIVWSKYLSLLLGNSIHGVATVVASFLGGLGVGAWLGGRIADRAPEPLRLYARLETIVGTLGIVSPLVYLAAKPVFAGLYGAMGGGGTLFLMIRFLLLFAVLLPPTIAMGATLPLLASDFARRGAGFDASVGRLYALNTAGAVGGVVAAGFLLIPAIGLWKTALLAGFLDLGVAALVTWRRPGPPPLGATPPLDEPRALAPAAGPQQARLMGRLIVPLFALSGFTAILAEIAWTRILSVPLGGMVYALSAILAIYLLGLALGSAAASRILRALPLPILLFGIVEILLAALVVGGGHLFGRIPLWQASIISRSPGIAGLLVGEVAIAALFVLPPTLALGALFPLAAAIRQRVRGAAGASVGAVYAANTVGSIAGSLLTGFVLLPWIGALKALLLGSAINAAIGITAILFGEGAPARRRMGALLAGTAVGAAGLLLLPTWPAARMSLGLTRLIRAYRFGGDPVRGWETVTEMIETSGTKDGREQLRFYREGRLASVAVVESPGRMGLVVNGKPDATTGSGEDMMTQVLIGQIPLLLRPEAQDVCIVGYGSGVTTHAVLTHPVREALTLEIEPAVIEAAPWFKDGAFDPLDDPRSRLVIEDAGTFLRSTSRKFDVIISEPSNPWIAGIGDLFTREFYKAAAARLRPGGIFCQWLQCYETSTETLSTIFRTLATRFPGGHVFFFRTSHDIVIVTSPDGPLTLNIETMVRTLQQPEIGRDLARVGVASAPDLLRYYRGTLEGIVARAGPGAINTDDNGWLEHRAPLDLVKMTSPGEPLVWSEDVASDLAKALVKDPESGARTLMQALDGAALAGDAAAARGFWSTLKKMGRPEAAEAEARIAALAQQGDRARQAAQLLSQAQPLLTRAAQGADAAAGAQAVDLLSRAAELDPRNGEIAWKLGTALITERKPDAGAAQLRKALTMLPLNQQFFVRRDLVIAEYFRRDFASALRELTEMEKLRPGAPEARYWRTRVFYDQGEKAQAREELDKGLHDYPANPRLNQLRQQLKW